MVQSCILVAIENISQVGDITGKDGIINNQDNFEFYSKLYVSNKAIKNNMSK